MGCKGNPSTDHLFEICTNISKQDFWRRVDDYHSLRAVLLAGEDDKERIAENKGTGTTSNYFLQQLVFKTDYLMRLRFILSLRLNKSV